MQPADAMFHHASAEGFMLQKKFNPFAAKELPETNICFLAPGNPCFGSDDPFLCGLFLLAYVFSDAKNVSFREGNDLNVSI